MRRISIGDDVSQVRLALAVAREQALHPLALLGGEQPREEPALRADAGADAPAPAVSAAANVAATTTAPRQIQAAPPAAHGLTGRAKAERKLGFGERT